ncbi:MAG: serine hydrolase domain-containing protein [Arachnia sp.]
MGTESVDQLAAALSAAAHESNFSGVVLLRQGNHIVLKLASGMADRAENRPITIQTRFATASVTKGFTALTVVALIEEGLLGFDTTLRQLVGEELPHVDPAVTIEHLLGHTSGVGDYLDEDLIDSSDDYILDVPVHTLQGPQDYLSLLNRHRQSYPPGHHATYNNAGYIMLALAIERASGGSYHDEVRRRVFAPADMHETDFLRSDRLPAATALGYLSDGRTNILHLPVIGTGDGGAYTTAADMLRFWDALMGGRVVSPPLLERMTVPNEAFPPSQPGQSSGLGFWINPDRITVQLEGEDAGVSCRTGAHPTSGFQYVLIANNSEDVWPLAAIVDTHLGHMAGKT